MQHKIVSREEWLKARLELLEKEKAVTRQRDALSVEQRALPWVEIEKEYLFEGPSGELTLSDLFRGRSQLFLKHFMLGPGQKLQCVGCTFEVDHLEGILEHLENHDVSYVAVARAPIAEIEAMRKRMGWKFHWVSSAGSDFNYDFNVSYTPEQIAGTKEAVYNFGPIQPPMEDLSGDSVFFKDESGRVFHTYSAFARGAEQFVGAYGFLDVMPKGRAENGPYGMLTDWVRPRNMYGKGGMVEATGRYHPAACACSVHEG